ncbi:hypothetical protein bcere0026_29630 [Bacillus mycoides]|uniref:Novel toxin 15 domain-containing protein n=1 Tax=Bacillus mycoides TaxID=1405 RepID=C2XW87_BACMY|nr:hypothetical protein bcere0026_29630 [Bacillus mycoides]
MVQSLKENKTLKNALDAMKNTPIPVAVRMVDTGIGVKLPYIESSTVGEVAGKFSKASTAAKDDAYQLAKGSGGSGVSKEGSVAKGTGEVKNLDNVPRIDEIEVNFNYKTKFDSEEFARQLKDQEKGMNELTVYEYQQNRKRFIDEGRAIEGNAAQQAAREKALSKKIEELFESGMSWEEAEGKAASWLKTQAALHNPDQIAGGNPLHIGGLGDKRINSSLGSQWRYRIDIVDEQIKELEKSLTLEQRKNTYLNVKLTY